MAPEWGMIGKKYVGTEAAYRLVLKLLRVLIFADFADCLRSAKISSRRKKKNDSLLQ